MTPTWNRTVFNHDHELPMPILSFKKSSPSVVHQVTEAPELPSERILAGSHGQGSLISTAEVSFLLHLWAGLQIFF
jgi:hypothetical protein